MVHMPPANPCLTCGACCAAFKVTFLSAEVDDRIGGTVPLALVVEINRTRSAMRGTAGFFKRCAALEGTIGKSVHCRIYACRPSTCRAFLPNWEIHCHNAACNLARSRYGLQPFTDY